MTVQLRLAEDRIPLDGFKSPEVSIVAPTFNERANIRPFVAALSAALSEIEWELIVVDDDSPDGTYEAVREVSMLTSRVRAIRRVGRRGLSSAVIEGILASNAPTVAVIDADMQHDERILPDMLEQIRLGADLVVATRYAGDGGTGAWDQDRVRMSRLATRLSHLVIGDVTSDPMSGFFMARREVVNGAIYDLSQQGYKILLDLIASSPRSLQIAEVPYTFRTRSEGESKLSPMIAAQFLFMLIEKLSRGLIPPRFVLFAAVGSIGLAVHLLVLNLFGLFGFGFVIAQSTATFVAMIVNFVINNQFTFHDRRLTGRSWWVGLALFIGACSFGALANVSVANLAVQELGYWNVAGLIGAVLGAVFNFGLASSVVWRPRRPRRRSGKTAFAVPG